MKEIKLFNRDNAELYLVQQKDENPSPWKLTVRNDKDYVLKYTRGILKNDSSSLEFEAIDPAGGPFLAIGDILEDRYKIISFEDIETPILFDERNNNK